MYLEQLQSVVKSSLQCATEIINLIESGHDFKLVNCRCHYDLRKYSFTVRVTNAWNSLPEPVILANIVDTFKNRVDKFLKN